MERKTRSGKVIVEVKTPAKRGRKKKSEIGLEPQQSSLTEPIQPVQQQTIQPVRRSCRGKSQNETSMSQSMDVSNAEENSNLSITSLDESTKTSINDSQNDEMENSGEKIDSFYVYDKPEIAIKTLEIKLVDCCLHEKPPEQQKIEDVEMSSEEMVKLEENKEMDRCEMEILEIKEELPSAEMKPVEIEEKTIENDKNLEEKQKKDEIIQIKEEPEEKIVEVSNQNEQLTDELDVKIEAMDIHENQKMEIAENEVIPKPETTVAEKVIPSDEIIETSATVVKEEPQVATDIIPDEIETSFLRRSRRLKSIYLETPVTKNEEGIKEGAANSPDISKIKSKTSCSKKLGENESPDNDIQMGQKELDIKSENAVKSEAKSVQEIKEESRVIIPESIDVLQCDQRLSQFITIKDNIYIKSSDKVICKVNKTMKCDCTITEEDLKNGEMGCRYNCINRLLFIECSSKCRCGEFCDNQQFQRYNYSPISVFRTEKKGFGIRAEDDIPPETFIIEYVGEVLNNKQFEKRAKKYSKDKNRHYYFMALRSNAVIDATVKGNISRFINHSCDPNAMTQKWTVNGELRVGFFSIREIRRGEEITFDYQFQRYGKEAQKCYCESENCRGWIGENPESEEEEIEIEVEDPKAKGKGKAVKKVAAVKKTKSKTEIADKSEIEEEEPTKENEKTDGQDEDMEEVPATEKDIKKDVEKIIRKPRKRQDLLEDLEIEEEINDLTKSGLKNRAHTIRLARLIVRAKNTDARSRLLNILISGEFPCRRLFLDYNGLRLLHSWMCDISIKSSVPDIYLCIELMNALDLLPITNKTVLRDSKILERVEKWRNIDLEKKKLTKEEKKQAKADKKKNKAAGKLQHDNSLEQIKNEESVFVRTFDVLEELPMTKLILKETAYELLRKWEVLKEDFRIPKKQKQEIMIEHEREAGMEEPGWQQNSTNSIDNDRYKNRFGDDSFTSSNNRSSTSSYKKSIDPIERQHRRQMYAMKVAHQDLEFRMKELHETNCAIFGYPSNINPVNIPIRVNRVTGEYLNILGDIVPNPPNHHTFNYEPLTVSTNPDDYHLPPIDLPEHWKFAIDQYGRIYYYHEKIRQPQWEAPIKLLPLNIDSDCYDDGEIDSDESETETEDEEEEELKELLEMLKKKKQLMQSQAVNLQPSGLNTDEDDLEKKIMNNMISNPPDQAIKLSQLPAKKCLKKKSRRGLSTMKFIRPRTEEDKLYGRTETKRYKEVKEKLRRDKKRRMLLGDAAGNMSDEDEEEYGDSSLNESNLAKMVDELDILNKSKQLDKIRKIKKDVDIINKKKESPVDVAKLKKPIKPVPPPLSPADHALIRKQFRDEIKEEINKFLMPYREETCVNGKITSEEDYISLVNKLTFSVLTKESKHCAQSNSVLKATDSVKGKTKEYIKKYMSKFEGTYQRKSDEQDYASILSKM